MRAEDQRVKFFFKPTCLKFPLIFSSICIISKNMFKVAFLKSDSGTRVTSKNGPTIAGMKKTLCSPRKKIISALGFTIFTSQKSIFLPNFDHTESIWYPISTLMSPYFSIIFPRFTSENFSSCRAGWVKNSTAKLK